MSTVLSFKLVSGEEIVATVTSTKETILGSGVVASYSVRRPHILQFQPMGGGQLGLAFVPWTLSNPGIDNLEIPASAVLLTFTPAGGVEKQYLQQTSGIELATAF